VLEENLPPEAATPAAQPASGSNRLLAFAMLATVAVGGTATFALLSSSRTAPSPAAASATAPSAASRPADPPSVPAAAATWKANPEWVGFQKRAVSFELPAQNKVPIWLRQAHPHLVVRCVNKRLDVFMYMESAAQIEPQDERHTVRLQVDDDPEIVDRWQDSDEHDALFLPDGQAFLRRMSTAKVVRIGYRPHNAAAVVAEFHVGGLNDLLTPAAAAQCGLK
jgi:hypothetical protein